MNFSKVFLFLFSLAMMITLVVLVGAIKDANVIAYWVFVVCSVLNFIVNTYITYNISFDVQQASSSE